ncbi:DUF5010 domain-containing protein [Actinoplanes sp. CA-131856]
MLKRSLAAALLIAGLAAAPATAADAATTGTVLPGRVAGMTGTLGVTFGFSTESFAGGPYDNQYNQNFNRPMYVPIPGDRASYWDNYVEQLVAAGVDFVAVDLRGSTPGNPTPDGSGDPRILAELVAAITKRGVADKLKIAALDDTPASLTDRKNRVAHHTGGYSPPFDLADTTGAGEGGYQYFWDNNQREYLAQVPDAMRYKIDGKPVIYEWSMNDFAFTNQGGGNLAKLLRYGRERAKAEFGTEPYYIVDSSWGDRDPASIAEFDGVHNWFGLPDGYSTMTYEPIANDTQVTLSGAWDYATSQGVADFRNDVHTTTVVGAAAKYSFLGTGVEFLARTGAAAGTVTVSVDGGTPVTVTIPATSTPTYRRSVFQRTSLTDGLHTIEVVNKSTAKVSVDGFRVLSARPTTPNGRSYGVALPGFRVVNDNANMVIDPAHGQKLTQNLDATVNSGATATLIEGMTDWEENALLARTADGSYDERLTDYPGQRLDIMRQFSRDPFPASLRVEAEAADTYAGATPGNAWGVYRTGDLDVQATGDADGGWNVGDIADGEALTWKSQPLQGTVTLAARVATPNDGATLRFVVDGQAGPTVKVPNTGDWQTYETVAAGGFQFPAGTHHTVTLEFLTGQLNADYWTATTTAAPAAPAPLGPSGPITGVGAKCVDLAGGGAADGTRAVLNTCAGTASQSWTVATDGTLRAYGKCLTAAGTGNGDRVQLAACTSSAAQKWTAQADGHLVNGAAGMCLLNGDGNTADGNPLIVWTCGGDPGTVWALPAATPPAGQITGYKGKCAEAATPVQLNTCGTGAAQQWTVAADSTLRALGKCMSANGTADGTKAQPATCSTTAAQKWTAKADGTLVNGLSGKCLDATGPSSANGTPLQVWTCAASENQKWRLPA